MPTSHSMPRTAKSCICCDARELSSYPAVLMPFVAHRALGWPPAKIDETWGLRTIPSGYAYTICRTLACNKCKCLFLDIRFDDEEMESLYNDYRGEDYTRLRDHYEPGYRERNERLQQGIGYIDKVEEFIERQMQAPMSIIDWGGDTGKNTPFSGRRSLCHVFDFGAREMVGDALLVSKSEAQSRQYDLVVCSNVLEHTPYPKEVLREAVKCMSSASMIYIEVPRESIFCDFGDNAPLHKKHWHEHVNFFTEGSLVELCGLAGLDVLDREVLDLEENGEVVRVFQLICKLAP